MSFRIRALSFLSFASILISACGDITTPSAIPSAPPSHTIVNPPSLLKVAAGANGFTCRSSRIDQASVGVLQCWNATTQYFNLVGYRNFVDIGVSPAAQTICALSRLPDAVLCVGTSASTLAGFGFDGTAYVKSGTYSSLAVGESHVCALTSAGAVSCWGANGNGQAPATRSAASGVFVNVVAGNFFTCALRSDAAVECWGANASGQAPSTPFTASTGSFTQLSAASTYACGLRTDGAVQCWGDASVYGSAVTTASGGVAFTEVSTALAHICALRSDHFIQCWGSNSNGRAPALQNTSTYSHVSAGALHTCGMRTDGFVECWPAAARSETGLRVNRTQQNPAFAGDRFNMKVSVVNPALVSWTRYVSNTPAVCRVDFAGNVELLTPGACEMYVEIPQTLGGLGLSGYLPATVMLQFTIEDFPQPTNMSTTPHPAYVALSWIDHTSSETGFRIERRRHGSSGWSAWEWLGTTAPDAVSFNDSLVTADVTYQYRVSACTAQRCTDPIVGASVAITFPPAAPAAVVAVAADAPLRVVTTWTDASTDETSFQIQRRVQTAGLRSGWLVVGTRGANSTSFSDAGIVRGTRYQYRVQACNATECSPYVNSGQVIAETLPAAPTGLAGTRTSPSQVNVAWLDNASNETSMALQRRIRALDGTWSAWSVLSPPAVNATSAVDASATGRSQYRIQACNIAGCSAWAVSAAVLP